MDHEQKSPTEYCPRCREAGEIRKLIHIYYSRSQAFYTCENRDCVYFVTDKKGNPTKFQLDPDMKRLVPIRTPVIDDHPSAELEKRIPSLPHDFTESQNVDTRFASPNTVVPRNVMENNSQIYNVPRNTDASFSLPTTITSSDVLQYHSQTDSTFNESYKLDDLSFWSDFVI